MVCNLKTMRNLLIIYEVHLINQITIITMRHFLPSFQMKFNIIHANKSYVY